MAQSVGRLTTAQVMILRSKGSSPASGSVLRAQSLEPASDSVSPALSAPSLLALCLCPSFSKIINNKKIFLNTSELRHPKFSYFLIVHLDFQLL